ncbi:hypothetical protein ACEQ8H_008343 [Pleosporales sp. CAS-2024a]
MSTSAFKLDPTVFNATLYKQLTDLWLGDMDLSGQHMNPAAMKRWFSSDSELDAACADQFAHALEAIGPEHLPAPTAQPFIDEIARIAQDCPANGSAQAAWVALSLALLLDQMPRNIHRDHDGLRKVYTHYDPMALHLSRTLLSSNPPIPRVDLHPQWRHSLAHRMWLYMPLMHSEDIESHTLLRGILDEAGQELSSLQHLDASQMILQGQLKAEKEHRDILDEFGRYPHRNMALGRPSTEAEKKFLSAGGATFGVAQPDRDEL